MATLAFIGDIAGTTNVAWPANAQYIQSISGLTAYCALGDCAYPDGAAADFAQYDSAFSSLKSITKPVPGNHEQHTAGYAGYFGYFGTVAKPQGQPYYAFGVDNNVWRVWMLPWQADWPNGAGSAVYNFFQADLTQFPNAFHIVCHHWARYSNAPHGDNAAIQSMWNLAVSKGKHALMIGGHDHNYQRFQEKKPDGTAAAAGTGLINMVVGTGGAGVDTSTASADLLHTNADWGVGVLTTTSTGYDWKYVETITPAGAKVTPTTKDSFSLTLTSGGGGGGTGPTASFSFTQITGTLQVAFNNTSLTATSYSWNFGDGQTSTAASPTHTYAAAGTYTVSLTATNSVGSNTATHPVAVTPVGSGVTPPTASFNSAQVTGTQTIQFTDTSINNPTSWTWNFGDTATAPPPTSGLVAYYSMDAVTTSTLTDDSGNGHSGTLTNFSTPPNTVAGHAGTDHALQFSYSAQRRVEIPDTSALDLTTGMTIAAWIKLDNSVGPLDRYEVIEKGGSYWLNIRVDTAPQYLIRTGSFYGPSAVWNFFDSNTPVPVNQWCHVAASYDGTNVKIWLNGSNVGSFAESGAMAIDNEAIVLGAKHTITSGGGVPPEAWFNGGIDEVRIYNRACTAGEIGAMAGQGSGTGSTSTAQNPAHTFTSLGSYNVSLTAANSAGTSTVTRVVQVSGTTANVAWTPATVQMSGSLTSTVNYVFSTGTPVGQNVTWQEAGTISVSLVPPDVGGQSVNYVNGTYRVIHMTLQPGVPTRVGLDNFYSRIEVLNRSLTTGEIYFTVDGVTNGLVAGSSDSYVVTPRSGLVVDQTVVQQTFVELIATDTIPVTITGVTRGGT